MKGYYKDPELTARTIVRGWLKTGDIGYMTKKGYFYIVDRKKDIIFVFNHTIYPNEIEDYLASHPKVLEVGVVGVPDRKSGEAVKAYIVKKDESLKMKDVFDYCRKGLSRKKRPKYVEFIKIMPKSNVGKLLRRKLRGKLYRKK